MHSVFLPWGSSIPLAFIGAPMSHQMSHWEQPDTICSDNSLVAARKGQLVDRSVTLLNCRAWRPVTFTEWPASRFRKKAKYFGKRNLRSLYCSSTICAWSVSWQPNKQPAVMASLVLLSFLSDLVMLFCVRKCLFKTWSCSLPHACTIYVFRHYTPLDAWEVLQMCWELIINNNRLIGWWHLLFFSPVQSLCCYCANCLTVTNTSLLTVPSCACILKGSLLYTAPAEQAPSQCPTLIEGTSVQSCKLFSNFKTVMV